MIVSILIRYSNQSIRLSLIFSVTYGCTLFLKYGPNVKVDTLK